MSRLIPLGAFVPPLVILSAVFFGGCASPGVSRRASVLALPYYSFDIRHSSFVIFQKVLALAPAKS
jgi:hypothetical protein